MGLHFSLFPLLFSCVDVANVFLVWLDKFCECDFCCAPRVRLGSQTLSFSLYFSLSLPGITFPLSYWLIKSLPFGFCTFKALCMITLAAPRRSK